MDHIGNQWRVGWVYADCRTLHLFCLDISKVKEKYRRQGVLRGMVASEKLQGKIELDSLFEEEHIWKKLGFVWNGTMSGTMHRLINSVSENSGTESGDIVIATRKWL